MSARVPSPTAGGVPIAWGVAGVDSRFRGGRDWPHVPVARNVDAGGVVTRSVPKPVEVCGGRVVAPTVSGHLGVCLVALSLR